MGKMHIAIWYVENIVIPSVEEARERLEYIQNRGSTPYAFTFKQKFSETEFVNYKITQ